MELSKLIKSPRFWIIVVIALLQVMVVFNFISGTQSESLIQIVQTFLAGIVAVRTLDRNGDKKVEAAKITANV